MTPLPGPARQIGFVVEDFDATLQSWLAIGVGPWHVMRGISFAGLYRNQPCEVTLSIGLTNIGDMQIEVIQQENDGPSIYTEFLDSGRRGFHQLAWWTADFDATLRGAQAAGWPVVWSGGQDLGARFAYLEPSAGPAEILEIVELSEGVSAFNDLIRDAADGWDGSDPIRTLG
ncbi:MAG: VOC family protein [Mycobacterium sp.]